VTSREVTVAALIAVVLLAAATVALVRGGQDRVRQPPGTTPPLDIEVRKVDEAHFSPVPDRPVFMAVLGTDARSGEVISRADALHVIGINPAAGRATILNIPRDTYVDIPGAGRDKINAAHARGGPVLTAQTLGALVGVPISFVVTTGFGGLVEMVDDLGGVDIDVPVAMNDSLSGARFPQGRHHMGGTSVLAFSRNRYISGGDFGRTQNQGAVIVAALAKLRAEGTGPANLLRWMSTLLRHCRFEGVGVLDLYRMGRLAASIDPGRVANVTMPGSEGFAGAASVVFPTAAAGGLFADFRDNAVVGG
jgi:LCP family protein required for cell wall assembly